jgi:hypothetical protein
MIAVLFKEILIHFKKGVLLRFKKIHSFKLNVNQLLILTILI